MSMKYPGGSFGGPFGRVLNSRKECLGRLGKRKATVCNSILMPDYHTDVRKPNVKRIVLSAFFVSLVSSVRLRNWTVLFTPHTYSIGEIPSR